MAVGRIEDQAAFAGIGLLSGIVGLLLMAQTVFGDESGWAGLQSLELTRLALVVVTAYRPALHVRLWRDHADFANMLSWWRYLVPLVLLIVVSGFALLLLRDFFSTGIVIAMDAGFGVGLFAGTPAIELPLDEKDSIVGDCIGAGVGYGFFMPTTRIISVGFSD
ncbi:MAG: hypothetical protein CSA09_02115 [Candidatus Contendobacter odensis]|uniref:Uncharacterized protein n=1 Tax=Candidatus Contendibacter odensensis TaxID=1400860 RepID=A0A2G6PGJ1_9GAMM|nr:MAG: hypothetical protein CSA09_02115 [Candidatus Contendobacter odensis]